MKALYRILILVSGLLWPGAGQISAGQGKLGWALAVSPFLAIALLSATRLIVKTYAVTSLVVLVVPLYLLSFFYAAYLCLSSKSALNLRAAVTGTGTSLLLVFLAITLFVSKPASLGVQAYLVPSVSMMPTLVPGDIILVDTWRYSFTDPHQGDVVVFDSPEQPINLVKRITAVSTARSGEEVYFLVGDNEAFSRDSRVFGSIRRRDISGQVTGVLLSLGGG